MSCLIIYALQLEKGKYYVGKTHSLELRFQQHKSSNGSEWTKKYKPISIIESYEHHSTFEEDILTKKYMMKYGIDNVRGGSYTKIELEEWQVKSLEHEFKSVSDKCFKCGRTGHFANECEKFKYMNIYLLTFETEEQLTEEIDKMEKLREHLKQEMKIIEHLKYCSYDDYEGEGTPRNYEGEGRPRKIVKRKFEIKLDIIEKLGLTDYKYEPNFHIGYNRNEKKSKHELYRECILPKWSSPIINFTTGQQDKLFDCRPDPENIKENVYKIYVNRVKREKTLNKLLSDNGLDYINYAETLDELNNRIEHLYEKLAKVLTSEI